MNKKRIITGASRGIGRELVKCFLEQGHDVLAISRNEEKLKELEKFATKSTYRYLALDLADFEGLTKVKSAIADWDRVDVLYNNAGYLRSEEHTSELQSRGHLVCRLLLEKKKRGKQS